MGAVILQGYLKYIHYHPLFFKWLLSATAPSPNFTARIKKRGSYLRIDIVSTIQAKISLTWNKESTSEITEDPDHGFSQMRLVMDYVGPRVSSMF